jgi:hypothetical protein
MSEGDLQVVAAAMSAGELQVVAAAMSAGELQVVAAAAGMEELQEYRKSNNGGGELQKCGWSGRGELREQQW